MVSLLIEVFHEITPPGCAKPQASRVNPTRVHCVGVAQLFCHYFFLIFRHILYYQQIIVFSNNASVIVFVGLEVGVVAAAPFAHHREHDTGRS